MKKAKCMSFIIIAFLICILPVALMPILGSETDANERGVTKDCPPIIKDGSLNLDFGSEFDAFISDNFALRKDIINFQAKSRNTVFKTSNNDKVTVGKEGYLFFNETLDDYQGENLMSTRQANNTAKMLQIIQKSVNDNGSAFTLAIVPNKNAVYPEYMPDYFKKGDKSNIDILTPFLDKYGVNYTDLFTPFKEEPSVLYCKTDSHWNNRGALMGDRLIVQSLNRTSRITVDDKDFTKRFDYSGDLAAMLYPTESSPLEDNFYYGIEGNYSCVNDMPLQSIRVVTNSNSGQGKLVMYRDSFGDALIPYISQEFENSVFSKAVPYNISIASNADCVVIEKTQRHINTFTDDIPYVHLAPIDNVTSQIKQTKSEIHSEDNDDDILIYGGVDKRYTDELSPVYLEINSDDGAVTYEAFPCKYELSDTDPDYSFGLYLDKSQFEEGKTYSVSVITMSEGVFVKSSDTLIIK